MYFTSLNNVKWRRPVKPGRSAALRARAAPGARHDVQDVRRGEGGRASRGRSGDGRGGARQMSATHSSDGARSIASAQIGQRRRDRRVRDRRRRMRDRRRLRRSRRGRRSSATCILGARRADRQRQRARRRPAGSQVQGRANDRRDRRGNDDSRVHDDQSRHVAVVQDDRRQELLSDVVRASGARLSHRRRRDHLERHAARRARDDRREGDHLGTRRRSISSRRSADTASSAAARAWRRTFRRT